MSSAKSERASLLPGQDGGPGALVKPSRDSPAVAITHPVFPYSTMEASGPFGITQVTNYEAVLRNLQFKQAAVVAANVDQRVDYQQHQAHSEQQQRFRDARDVDLSQQHQQRTSALLVNSSIDRPPFPSSPHRALIYHPHVSSYASPRPPPVVMDSSNTVKRPRLMADFTDIRPLHVDVEPKRADSVASGSAYKPQVEAISPTLPADDAHGNEIRHSIDELVQHIHRVEGEIQNITVNIEKLKKNQEKIELEAKKPLEEKMAASEPSLDMRSQSISQTIYAENRKKAAIAHSALDKLGEATIMPRYAQPSDTEIFKENKTKFAVFKKTLILYLKKQHQATKIRERCLSERYDKLLESWTKRLEKMEKRRLKDTKTREFFEKIFPEMKKQREDKERMQRVSGSRSSGYARSDANVEQIVENLHEQEEEERKMRNLAVIPPMLLDARQRQRRYQNECGLLEDPVQVNMESISRTLYWTAEEKEIFREKYLQRPKNFGYIAAAIENKTASDCVLFYYTSKKSAMYKQLVRRHNATSRKRKFRTPAAASAAAAAAAAAQAAREAKEEKPEVIEHEHESSATIIEEKKAVTDATGKQTPSGSEQESNRTADVVENGRSVSNIDSLPVAESDRPGPSNPTIAQSDGRQNGDANVEQPVPRPEDSGGHRTGDRFVIDAPEQRGRMSTPPVIASGLRTEKETDRQPFLNGLTEGSSELLKNALVSNAPPELTAAQLIEAIIAQETRGLSRSSNRRRAGSRSSNGSDHTSDTLSADESQYEDVDRERLVKRSRQSESTTDRRVGDQLSSVLIGSAGDSTTGPASLLYNPSVPRKTYMTGRLSVPPNDIAQIVGSDGKNVTLGVTDSRHHVLQSSEAAILPLADRKVTAAKVSSGGLMRVRDVIHSAIEENLQLRPGDPNHLSSSEELWKIYTQQPPTSVDAFSARRVDQINSDTSMVQDLSCRRSDGGQRDPYTKSSRNWPADGQSMRKISPPPAHNNYIRQQPTPASVQIDPRSQDPLYHLAEVAVQRERVEIGDRHARVASPQVAQHLRDVPDQVLPSQLVGGSISRGTPVHPVLLDAQPGRSVGLPRRQELVEMPKLSRDSNLVVTGPQVVAMAEDVLQYLNPPPSHRAVMEHAIAAIQPHVNTGSSASRSVLISDFQTAQQMSNAQQQQHLSRSIPDLDSLHEPPNGFSSRTARSDENVMLSAMSGTRPLTAARVIEAIITQQINSNTPMSSANSVISNDLINRIMESPVVQGTDRRVVVNGTAAVANGIPAVSIPGGLSAGVNVNERIVMERIGLPSSRTRLQAGQGTERTVTLGEHIDAMIQKDFSSQRFNDDNLHPAETTRFTGPAIDAGTKTSLRSFLENSADFNANSNSRGQGGGGPANGCVSDVMRSNVRQSPALGMGPNSGVSRSPWQRDTVDRDSRSSAPHALDSAAVLAVHHSSLGQKARGRSPPVLGTNQSFSSATFVTSASNLLMSKASSANSVFSVSPIPVSAAASSRPVGTSFSQGVTVAGAAALPMIAPPQLQETLPANLLNTSSVLKVGIPVQWPGLMANSAGNVSDTMSLPGSVVNVTVSEDESPAATTGAATGWKKKMSHDLQRQEQERNAEQKMVGVCNQSAVRSRPSSRSVTPAAPSVVADQDKSRLSSDQTGQRSSWTSGSRDGFLSEPIAALKSASPRSPRASGVSEKPLSTIAMSHQTMSSLLQSRPVFAADKSPASDATAAGLGRTSVGSDVPMRPSSNMSDTAQSSSGLPESPAKASPATERPSSVTDVSLTERVASSPASTYSGQGSVQDSAAAGGETQK